MKTNHKTRPATRADLQTIGGIAENTNLFPADMLEGMIAGYLNKRTEDIWFVCTKDEKVISFGFCEPERATSGTWNLLAIGVHPDHQGEGVGASMIAYLEAELRCKKARVLIVETLGTPEFERTRTFYRKLGFVEEARIREFYEPGGDKIVFWKHL